jgi:riboflavin synthase
VGHILARSAHEHWEVVRIALPAALARYVVEKGSVAVDGVSLTVSAVSEVDVREPWFEVSLIPTTLRETTLGARAPGELVNLEVDVIAKYVERLLGGSR